MIIKKIWIFSLLFTCMCNGIYAQMDCWNPSQKDSKLSLQLYGGGDLVFNNISLKNDNVAFTELLEARDSSASMIGSIKYGALIKYKITNALYVKAGIELNTIHEKFEFESNEETTDIIPDQVTSFSIDAANDTTFVYGDLPVTTITSTEWNINNSYKMLSIPVIIGYKLIDSEKFELNIETGILQNLTFDFEGYILDDTISPIGTDNTEIAVNNLHKTRLPTTLFLGTEAILHINEKLGFLFGMSNHTPLGTLTSNSNPLNQQNYHFGAKVGIEIRL